MDKPCLGEVQSLLVIFEKWNLKLNSFRLDESVVQSITTCADPTTGICQVEKMELYMEFDGTPAKHPPWGLLGVSL